MVGGGGFPTIPRHNLSEPEEPKKPEMPNWLFWIYATIGSIIFVWAMHEVFIK